MCVLSVSKNIIYLLSSSILIGYWCTTVFDFVSLVWHFTYFWDFIFLNICTRIAMPFACGFLHVLPRILRRLPEIIIRWKVFDERARHFFKVTTTSEEKSVTESTDDTEKPRNLISDSDSEENEEEMEDKQEKKETLEEKIDRLASESSDEDEDFDVSNRDVTYWWDIQISR